MGLMSLSHADMPHSTPMDVFVCEALQMQQALSIDCRPLLGAWTVCKGYQVEFHGSWAILIWWWLNGTTGFFLGAHAVLTHGERLFSRQFVSTPSHGSNRIASSM